MLPPGNRLRKPADFAVAIRHGHRAAAGRLVVHLHSPAQPTTKSPRVGLVVPKAVGNAVARNRVKRRLRHLLRDRLTALSDGELLVVRAGRSITELTSEQLATQLDEALRRARLKMRPKTDRGVS